MQEKSEQRGNSNRKNNGVMILVLDSVKIYPPAKEDAATP